MALTRESLRTELRDLIGEYTSVDPATDTRLNRFLNRAIRFLAGEVRRSHPEYYVTYESISAEDGTYLYDLPDTWVSTQQIVNSDGGTVRPADTRYFIEPADNKSSKAGWFGLYGPQVWLYKTPSADETYTHFYTTTPTDMTTDSGATGKPDFPPGFDELIVLDAAKRFCLSQGCSYGDIAPLREDINKMILDLRNYDWQQFTPRRVVVGEGFFGPTWPNTHGAT